MLWRLCLLIVAVWLNACQAQQAHDIKETRFLLGTIVEFTVYTDNDALALSAIRQAAAEMQQVERKFTIHGAEPNSVRSFNQALAGQEVQLDTEVNTLLMQSLAMHQQTQGAFDPTLGDLNLRWGFSSEKKPTQPLPASLIEQGLTNSGVLNVEQTAKQTWLKKKNGLKLDFGAIAKGLAIDKGIESLLSMGVKHAIINAGGDMRVIGDHGGKPWTVAVRHPRLDTPLGWFEVSEGVSIVTSGDYERFFLHDGKRYHHILDPGTGVSVMSNMSVTISAPTAAIADALSTAMFVLGYEKGVAIIEAMPDTEAIWVNAKQEVQMSSGMTGWFHTVAADLQVKH